MHHRPLSALSAALALALSPALFAHEAEPAGAPAPSDVAASAGPTVLDHSESPAMQAGIDTDQVDSYVAATATLEFPTLDANADGFVDEDEVPSESPLATHWKDYDADGDLRLSAEEFTAWDADGGETDAITATAASVGISPDDLDQAAVDADDLDGDGQDDAPSVATGEPMEDGDDLDVDVDADVGSSVATDPGDEFETSDAEDFE